MRQHPLRSIVLVRSVLAAFLTLPLLFACERDAPPPVSEEEIIEEASELAEPESEELEHGDAEELPKH